MWRARLKVEAHYYITVWRCLLISPFWPVDTTSIEQWMPYLLPQTTLPFHLHTWDSFPSFSKRRSWCEATEGTRRRRLQGRPRWWRWAWLSRRWRRAFRCRRRPICSPRRRPSFWSCWDFNNCSRLWGRCCDEALAWKNTLLQGLVFCSFCILETNCYLLILPSFLQIDGRSKSCSEFVCPIQQK